MLANGRSIEATLHSLIDSIYESAVDASAFPTFMKQLALATDSHFAGIEVVDPGASNLCQWQASGSYGLPADTVSGFNSSYGAHNPFVDAVSASAREGSIFFDSDVLQRKQYTAMDYYDLFLKHYDFEYLSGLYVIHNPEISIIATTSRGRSAGPFTANERKLFELILPHIQRFFRIEQKIGTLIDERDTGWEALERQAYGTIVLDRLLRPIFMNSAARTIIDRQDGLASRHGKIVTLNTEANKTLIKQLAFAVSAYDDPGSFREKYDAVAPRRGGKRPYYLQIIPIRLSRALHEAKGAAALLFIQDPEQKPVMPTQAVSALFGLTKAEAEVAVLVARGLPLEDVADEMRHSVATTRTLLKRIFAKTDTHRQNELVSLLMGGITDSPG